jgi:RimJ/RimL family protein N-acetyltransferase
MGWGGALNRPAHEPGVLEMKLRDPLPRDAGIAVLRRLQLSDLAVFQAYRHDPRVARYQDWYGTRTDAEANDFLARMGAIELFQRGVCSQIGIADPDQLALVGDIGLTLAAEAQGRGIATAAVREVIRLVFERTEAERVEAIVDPLNVRSLRLLDRVGMRLAGSREGTFRNAPCVDQVYEISRH